MAENPFIQLYEKERREGDRWNFYYISEDLAYSADSGESITAGIKLNCKFVRSMWAESAIG